MAEKDVDLLYQEHIENGLEEEGASDDERRASPRLKTEATELTVRAELQVDAIDISMSGLAFYSGFPVKIGQPLQITVGSMFTVDAEVVMCKLEDHDSDFMDLQYKVQCSFPDEEQGKYLLVAIKELERRNRALEKKEKLGQEEMETE